MKMGSETSNVLYMNLPSFVTLDFHSSAHESQQLLINFYLTAEVITQCQMEK